MGTGQEETRDEDLMALIATGDEEAFRQLVERHQDRVYGTVAKMLGGTGPDVEELAQEIFLRVWRAAPKYEVKAKFTTWLMTITRNLVFTFVESRKSRRHEWQRKAEEDGEDLELAREASSGRRTIGQGTCRSGRESLCGTAQRPEDGRAPQAVRGDGV